jgi:hypothetical protein
MAVLQANACLAANRPSHALPAVLKVLRMAGLTCGGVLCVAFRRSGWPRRLTVGSVAAMLACSVGMRAMADDIANDARRAEAVWASTSGRVIHLPPVFLVAGEVRPVPLSSLTLTSTDAQCTTVGVLGASTVDFTLELRGDETSTSKALVRESEGMRSVAGASTLVRCGSSRRELEGLAIRMKSPQGALEVLVARGDQPASPLDSLFPERAAGPSQPELDGPPLRVASPRAERVSDAERAISQQGGRVVSKQEVTSDGEGRGALRLRLAEGCHRVVVVAEARGLGAAWPMDVDCELVDASSRDVLARDRSFAPDGTIHMCTGNAADVWLRWGGAPAGAATTVLQGSWPIASGIPGEWPSRARAGLMQAAIRRQVPLPEPGPAWEFGGVTGRTAVPVPVTPGVCYVVGVGASQGDVRAIRLTMQQGARLSTDSGQVGSDGAALSFCAGESGSAQVDVNAIGAQVVWHAGLWPVGRVRLGLEESR